MGRLCTNVADCEYHECNQRLTEQFIHRLDERVMIGEILRELSVLKDIKAQRVEALGAKGSPPPYKGRQGV